MQPLSEDLENRIKQLAVNHIGKSGLTEQAEKGAGVWLVRDNNIGVYVTLDSLTEYVRGDIGINHIIETVDNADLSSQVVVVFIKGTIGDTQFMRVVDIPE